MSNNNKNNVNNSKQVVNVIIDHYRRRRKPKKKVKEQQQMLLNNPAIPRSNVMPININNSTPGMPPSFQDLHRYHTSIANDDLIHDLRDQLEDIKDSMDHLAADGQVQLVEVMRRQAEQHEQMIRYLEEQRNIQQPINLPPDQDNLGFPSQPSSISSAPSLAAPPPSIESAPITAAPPPSMASAPQVAPSEAGSLLNAPSLASNAPSTVKSSEPYYNVAGSDDIIDVYNNETPMNQQATSSYTNPIFEATPGTEGISSMTPEEAFQDTISLLTGINNREVVTPSMRRKQKPEGTSSYSQTDTEGTRNRNVPPSPVPFNLTPEAAGPSNRPNTEEEDDEDTQGDRFLQTPQFEREYNQVKSLIKSTVDRRGQKRKIVSDYELEFNKRFTREEYRKRSKEKKADFKKELLEFARQYYSTIVDDQEASVDRSSFITIENAFGPGKNIRTQLNLISGLFKV